MKIYISHSSKYDYVNKIYEPIKKSNLSKSNTFIFPHEEDKEVINTKQIISECDLVIAEVSLSGIGQGIELGWADFAKIPILCIYEKGINITSSLKFITNDFIEYENQEDMINKIGEFLRKRSK